MELGMVQKFKIDYEVRDRLCLFLRCERCSFAGRVLTCPRDDSADPCARPRVCVSPPDAVQMAADCQKKLQDGSLSQLEARLQRLSVHVRHAYGKDPAATTVGVRPRNRPFIANAHIGREKLSNKLILTDTPNLRTQGGCWH